MDLSILDSIDEETLVGLHVIALVTYFLWITTPKTLNKMSPVLNKMLKGLTVSMGLILVSNVIGHLLLPVSVSADPKPASLEKMLSDPDFKKALIEEQLLLQHEYTHQRYLQGSE